jgi:predicted AAA+ superfamily ATPase
MNFQEPLSGLIERIARAIERLSPRETEAPDFTASNAFVWQAEAQGFVPVADVNRVALSLLKGIDRMRDTLFANTERFARGLPANNALLWGARGMGKSSLVKAVHGEFKGLKLVEIHREDIASLPHLLSHLRAASEHRFISLSDRFGVWIGFHNCSQDDYLDMVRSYARHYRLAIKNEALREEALAWALQRGGRSGRVAWQYIQDLAGRLGTPL